MPQSRFSIWDLSLSGFDNGRFSDWREGYALETKFTKTAYHNMAPWEEGWKRSPLSSLRCSSKVLRHSTTAIKEEDKEDKIVVDEQPKKTEFDEYADFVRDYAPAIYKSHTPLSS